MEKEIQRIALIGPISFPSRPDTLGGATRLFEVMRDYALGYQSSCAIIISNQYDRNGIAGRIQNLFHVLFQVLIHERRCNIWVLNVSQGGIQLLFPVLFVLSQLFRKKLVLRAFGAHLLDTVNASPFKKTLTRFVKQLPLIYVESKSLLERTKPLNSNAKWFPNVRDVGGKEINWQKTYKKSFVYIGQIRESKGIPELIAVFDELGDDYSLRIYGPIMEESLNSLAKDPRYGGSLSAEEVNQVLSSADVLVLPTRYQGEGYPGIIIEAYSWALPVVTTNWRSVPELVEHMETGWLLPPGVHKPLKDCIESIQSEKWGQMRKKAFAKAQEFDSKEVHDRVFDELLLV